MRKSFAAMGLAAVLMAPAFLSAASKESTEAQAGPDISTHADITMVSKKTSKKAKAVINKIKAIKSQKADYIQKTKTAKSAYDKLSKKDKKLVANYSTLKKHWAKIQPALKKVKKLQADVTKLTDKNYRTKAAPLKKTYDSMNAISKAAVPASTVKKLNHYSNVTGSYRLMTLAVGNANSGTQEKNGPKIYNFLTSYNKLSGAQKNLLDHLMSSDEKSKLNGYLTQADTIKTAAALEKKYASLKTSSNTYGKDAVTLYWEYTKATVADSEVAGFMPNSSKIVELQKIYEKQIVAATTFANLVDSIDEGSASKEELLKKIQDAVTSYKNISRPTASSTPNVYPKLAPIDIVDKKIIATYKKYETIPSIVEGILNLPDFIKVVPGSLTSAQIDNLIDQLAKYKKLGADQKEIVQANAQEKKPYLLEEKNVASAQTIDKSYDSVQKKKTSPTYLADLQKVFDAYDNSIIDVRRFIKNALTIAAIPTSPVYKEAKIAADDFAIDVNKLSANSTLQDVKSVVAKYNTMSNAKPNQTALVDKIVLKTYNQYAGIPQVVTAFNKIPDKTLSNGYYGYSTKNITDLLSNIKTYKKLGTPQKAIVDNSTTTHKPTIEMLAGEEANIKEAQGLDKAYAKLKKSSKNYPKEAKKVHIDYLDASPDTLKYLVNGLKMEGLDQAYKSQQQLASTFEEMVNQLNRKSNATQDVLPVVRYYLAKVEPYSKISNLVDSKIFKKYKQYEPIADIMQIFDLIKITNENDISPTNIEYIQQAIKTYKKLAADPKKVIDDADRSKYKFLQDGDEIAQAATIDKAFEKIKPTDSKYEVDVLKVYYTLYDRAPSQVKKYVANKKALEEVATRYIPQLATAREFEQMVKDLSEVSNKGYTPGVQDVKKVKDYYVNNVKYNKINAQYNVPLETIIDPTIMEQYHKFEDILTIQDIAKSMYVQYGRFVEGKGYASGDKLKNKNDVNSIVKVITLYNRLDSPQRAIVSKAPRYANDHSYEESHNIPYDPNRVFEENEIIRPSIPLNDVAIQNFLEAQKINAAYEALKPSSSSYRDGAIALYYRYMNAGPNVQAYVIYSKEIEDFANRFNAATIKAEIDAFIQALNKLSKNSLYEDVNSVVKQYNALNEVQLSLLDKPTLAKYNSYAPLVEMGKNIAKITNQDFKYNNNEIQAMLSTIAIYKKLAKDPKTIVANVNNKLDLNKPFLADEAAIKQAQKLDKSYQSLDPNSKKYGNDLKKLIQDYGKLSTTAKKYVVTDFEGIQNDKNNYQDPKLAADAFEQAVNRLSPESIYKEVSDVVDMYNSLNQKARTYLDSKVLAVYNKYAPIVLIVNILQKPGTPYSNAYIDNITQAIALYNKLGKDQKAIVDRTIKDNDQQKNLLNEGGNIKAAQELDKKIVAITPGKSGYTKAVIEAGKTYDAMSVNAQNYVKNKSKLREYRTDKNIEPSIKKLADFEKGVAEVEELAADETNNNCETGTCSKDIVDKMVILERLYQDLNIPKLIKGEEIKLSTLIDRKVLQRYQYFYAVYDIKNQLDNL
ncbi:hypothetical protein [Rummeliibacillus stabekisii]|uniref:Uncharacterized protein n=1 Tax=Rummeliibacillus stabekisii TaxID=241244 RepID=A0A143H8V2_9BACL|nr:hypothetical protein [Rummeliibacillus stabekisii]AMW98177.1 hypothetical protein ATY39_01325 [Rummeliibacillus stabekisii]